MTGLLEVLSTMKAAMGVDCSGDFNTCRCTLHSQRQGKINKPLDYGNESTASLPRQGRVYRRRLPVGFSPFQLLGRLAYNAALDAKRAWQYFYRFYARSARSEGRLNTQGYSVLLETG
jgi:hypothetical protein